MPYCYVAVRSQLVGTWYDTAVKPNVFLFLSKVVEVMNSDGDNYSGTITVKFLHLFPWTFSASWKRKGNSVALDALGLEIFNSDYEVLAVGDNFFIDIGHPISVLTGIVLIHYRQPCPDQQTQQEVKNALQKTLSQV
ncbi:hypothetical protein L9F63_016605 [Diploptera punctata]|uniref:Uncharacterized protein n=1 Tax=Diploptera punctata TaxID=6984 RepID=A0AAD8EHD8_DIPPU|nr:hypothetical protein L9F63_016605 [Diploptera punctata]